MTERAGTSTVSHKGKLSWYPAGLATMAARHSLTSSAFIVASKLHFSVSQQAARMMMIPVGMPNG